MSTDLDAARARAETAEKKVPDLETELYMTIPTEVTVIKYVAI